MSDAMSNELANEIYDVLVEVCGATNDNVMRPSFLHAFTKPNHTAEWRFIGSLGFGGKFWACNGKFYVNCYQEHENTERLATIAEANRRLAEIHSRVYSES